MRTVVWNEISDAERRLVLGRPARSYDADLRETVAAILRDVKVRGDEAVKDFARSLDDFADSDFRVQSSEIMESPEGIDRQLRGAMERAIANLSAFHAAQLPRTIRVETMPGITCELHWHPVERVGFYVPGGTAPLFSSLLMQAIPARIAGCTDSILCTPPQRDGRVHPAILAAAKLCGIENIYAIGGAQAIAAMAYGTATIPKVDKISGPGNAFVTSAKQMVAQDPAGAAIDLPAGPSEVMVVAEVSARPDWIAADLLAQAEHGLDAHALFVTTSATLAASVQADIHAQTAGLRRRAIVETSLNSGSIIVVPNMQTAIGIVNRYAPEHLILHDDDADSWLPEIRHAGSIFLGRYSPETAGDYASGANHVLPTGGLARAYGGITVFSFLKSMTVQRLQPEGLQNLGPALIAMAEAEGLQAHANAVSIRLRAAA
ncbi:MAG TPA: histidinol dehydrogenase [Rhizomicrobium sp.]|jgi:histidinol dehydrogenase|nr:histidinol dehydrogenase [Rhizomicrobium sp.]